CPSNARRRIAYFGCVPKGGGYNAGVLETAYQAKGTSDHLLTQLVKGFPGGTLDDSRPPAKEPPPCHFPGTSCGDPHPERPTGRELLMNPAPRQSDSPDLREQARLAADSRQTLDPPGWTYRFRLEEESSLKELRDLACRRLKQLAGNMFKGTPAAQGEWR